MKRAKKANHSLGQMMPDDFLVDPKKDPRYAVYIDGRDCHCFLALTGPNGWVVMPAYAYEFDEAKVNACFRAPPDMLKEVDNIIKEGKLRLPIFANLSKRNWAAHPDFPEIARNVLSVIIRGDVKAYRNK